MQHHTANPLSGTVFWCEPALKAAAKISIWFDNVSIHPPPLGNESSAHWF